MARLRPVALALGLIAAVVLTAAPVLGEDGLLSETAAPLWHVLDGGLFEADFPGVPIREIDENRTIVGTVRATRYVYRTAASLLMVEHHRLPRLGRALAPASLILDLTKDEVLTSRGAEALSFEEIPSEQGDARLLRYRKHEADPGEAKTSLHLIGRDLYLITAEAGRDEADRSMVRRFFESFRLRASD